MIGSGPLAPQMLRVGLLTAALTWSRPDDRLD
jgi:hypothetical protein